MLDHDVEQRVQNTTTSVKTTIKNRSFDIIALFIIIAMLALNLGVLELRDITLLSIVNILLECVPFFIASVLLSVNYYRKGVHVGKCTDKFIGTSAVFSKLVADLSGTEIAKLQDFCDEYNTNLLKQIQTNALKAAAITYERFNDVTVDNGKTLQPLKILSKTDLLSMYTTEQVRIILKTKKIKIRGLNPNILLGNTTFEDTSNLGDDEQTLNRKNTTSSAVIYLSSTLLLSMIGVKDVLMWGWAGLLITVFKLVYVACSSAMKHFKGYNDVTIHLTNHIARKSDILKQFKTWYESTISNT